MSLGEYGVWNSFGHYADSCSSACWPYAEAVLKDFNSMLWWPVLQSIIAGLTLALLVALAIHTVAWVNEQHVRSIIKKIEKEKTP